MRGKNGLWIRILAALVAGLLVSSFFIPEQDACSEWLPLLSGFVDMGPVYGNPVLSGILGMVFNILISLSVLSVNSRSLNNPFDNYFTVLFLLFISLLNPAAVYFSSIHVALLLFIWGQYCFVVGKKFTSMFLLSCASLFCAPFIWTLPLVLAFSLFGAADFARTFTKSLGGLLLPLAYVLVFRHFMFQDALVFMEEYYLHASDVSFPFWSLGSTAIFLLICFCAASLHAVSYIFSGLSSSSILTEHIIKMEIMSLIIGLSVLFFFWGHRGVPVNMVVALPLSFVLSIHFSKNLSAPSTRIEFILLCCAAAISRIHYFM